MKKSHEWTSGLSRSFQRMVLQDWDFSGCSWYMLQCNVRRTLIKNDIRNQFLNPLVSSSNLLILWNEKKTNNKSLTLNSHLVLTKFGAASDTEQTAWRLTWRNHCSSAELFMTSDCTAYAERRQMEEVPLWCFPSNTWRFFLSRTTYISIIRGLCRWFFLNSQQQVDFLNLLIGVREENCNKVEKVIIKNSTPLYWFLYISPKSHNKDNIDDIKVSYIYIFTDLKEVSIIQEATCSTAICFRNTHF